MSLNQTLGGAEETTVYIDKIITIREVTSVDVGRVDEDIQVCTNFKIIPAPSLLWIVSKKCSFISS